MLKICSGQILKCDYVEYKKFDYCKKSFGPSGWKKNLD